MSLELSEIDRHCAREMTSGEREDIDLKFIALLYGLGQAGWVLREIQIPVSIRIHRSY